MRKKDIGGHTLELLHDGKINEAIDAFHDECDDLTDCKYSNNKEKCVKLCLLPKLSYLDICANNPELKGVLHKLHNQ
ncbi:hypothetical protein [Pseudemcibacter aquimaris]|uniref:hypothetical protein n=1 Tax=Pseudemcibacter aquimaris TaxID=2857064 RepID=UPI0020138F84|nr:hypothetical protein [Pseudemcibacter aquimaris]MCC3859659.1 hypothetical protein [Pseudemcibacter aquimaris]WDU60054.1 hypothetical protein KW060_07260 [Pseudemcibacter aquimaris]